AVLDTATAEPLGSHQLAARGGVFRSLAVGPITGRLYLSGNRAGRVVVMVLDPDTGTVLTDWTARERDGRDWSVYQGAVSDDERDLFISYHGTNTTGIDRFTIVGDGLQRCRGGRRPNAGCLG